MDLRFHLSQRHLNYTDWRNNMKLAKLIILTCAFVLVFSARSFPQESTECTTFDVIITKVRLASRLLEEKGAAGLAEFNRPDGPWVWADTYIFVYNCKEGIIAAHPNNDLIGQRLETLIDAKGTSLGLLLCNAAKLEKGGFAEYWWERLGEAEALRKITYIYQVPGQPYEVAAGIYEPSITLTDLELLLERTGDPVPMIDH
jgi:cytochrome c